VHAPKYANEAETAEGNISVIAVFISYFMRGFVNVMDVPSFVQILTSGVWQLGLVFFICQRCQS